MSDRNVLWEKAVAFHGHECGGLMIGFKAALYAMKLLGREFSEDEELVCIIENDTCSVDAIQAILGCTAGKGNLLFHMTGKQAFSIFDRTSGKSFRLVLKPRPEGMTREESFEYYKSHDPEDLFDVKPVKRGVPERARIFESFVCDRCGEQAGARWIRFIGKEKVCEDCLTEEERYDL